MILQRLREALDKENVKYVVITHSVAFTAQEVAQVAHVPGNEVAKTVIFWMDGVMAMAVLPASRMIDFRLLREGTGAKEVTIAGESEFRDAFPDCELGAMPPFGMLFGMKTYIDASLREDVEIVFNAGSHRELVRMATVDLENIVHPVVLRFSFATRSAA